MLRLCAPLQEHVLQQWSGMVCSPGSVRIFEILCSAWPCCTARLLLRVEPALALSRKSSKRL